MSGKCVFNNQWFENPNYHDWLQQSQNNKHEAKCKLCCKAFSISSMGESALKSHMKSKKHVSLVKIRQSSSLLTMSADKPSTSTASMEKETNFGTIKSNVTEVQKSVSQPFESHFLKEDVLDAEIIWTLHSIKNHLSYKSNENIAKIFKAMFRDSGCASKFSCGEKKTAYYAVFGIAPYFKDLMQEQILNEDSYVLLFDETLNQMTQKKQMDIHIRFWSTDQVKTMFLTSVFMGHSSAEDLLDAFKNAISPIKLSKIFQISMDGPNVNLKFFRSLQDDISTEFNKQILNIGTCSLHTVHNAFKKGCESSGWEIDDFLSSAYYLFKDSPARREDFIRLTENSCFPKKFVKHRWLENIPAVECAQNLIPDLKKYVSAVEKGEFPKPPCKSFSIVASHLKDKLLMVKLQAFHSIAKLLQSFLTSYQTDKPMIFFLAEDIRKVLSLFLQRFIQPDVLKSANTLQKLLALQIKDPKIHCKVENIDIGFIANKTLKKLYSTKTITDREQFDLRMGCKAFLIDTVDKIIDKSPAQFILVRNLSCLDPRKMTDKTSCVAKFKSVINSLSERQQIRDNDCETVIQQFETYLDEVVTPQYSRFTDFNIEKMRIDDFLTETMNLKQFQNLWGVVKRLLLLSHGQATVERGFSVNKKIEVENLKEHSYVAHRLICDYIGVHAGGDILNVSITKNLRSYVVNARQKYLQYLEEQKSNTSKKRKADSTDSDILNMKKKKSRLETDIKALLKSADELAEAAEEKDDLTLITKSNSLRRSAKEKQKALLKLDELIQSSQN